MQFPRLAQIPQEINNVPYGKRKYLSPIFLHSSLGDRRTLTHIRNTVLLWVQWAFLKILDLLHFIRRVPIKYICSGPDTDLTPFRTGPGPNNVIFVLCCTTYVFELSQNVFNVT